MRSAMPKVMHKVGGLPMLGHVLAAARAAGATQIAVVVGPDAEAVRAFVAKAGAGRRRPRAGASDSARRTRCSRRGRRSPPAPTTCSCSTATRRWSRRRRSGGCAKALAEGADVVVRRLPAADPGRLRPADHREGGSSSPSARRRTPAPRSSAIGLCNAGMMAFPRRGRAGAPRRRSATDNAKGEYYLTDLVELANAAGKTVAAIEADADEVIGVNNRARARARRSGIFQQRARAGGDGRRRHADRARDGVLQPRHQARQRRDDRAERLLRPGRHDRRRRRPSAPTRHIEGATIATGAIVGPFARLRPGADDRAEGAHRQFRRGEERGASTTAPRSTT